MTDQAPVSGGGWLPQEELSAGRMRADGGSLRMRRTTFAGAPAWLVARFPAGGHGGRGLLVACWPLDLLEMSGPTMHQMLIVKAAHCGLLGFAVAR